MQQINEAIEQLEGRAFFIGPETEKESLKLMEKTRATIPLLYDSDGAVMEAYKLGFTVPPYLQPVYAEFGIDLPKANAQTGWRLPIPATFVVDRAQKVWARYVNADYRYRMEPAEILRTLEEVQE